MNLDSIIASAEAQYNLPKGLLHYLVNKESGGNPNALSPKGAGGVMQIMPKTATDLGLSDQDRFNPEKAIPAGANYLRQHYDNFGTWPLAFAAYNAGPGRVEQAGRVVPNIAETKDYVQTLMQKLVTDGVLPETTYQVAEDLALPKKEAAPPVAPTVPPKAENQRMGREQPQRPKGIGDMTEEEWKNTKKRMQEMELPPGYGSMGHAEVGRVGAEGNDAKDMSMFAHSNLQSLMGLLLSGKLGGQLERKQIFNGNLKNYGW